jgi:hypothetical protein
VGGAAPKDNTLDGSFAAHARLAFAGVDAVEELETAFFAVGIDIIS